MTTSSPTHRVILDTDIGTDVDDCLALAAVLGSPELDLVAVTTVYGDVHLRGRMVARLLRLAGRDDVPVHLGSSQTILGQRPIHWAGHEGVGLIDEADDNWQPAEGHAVDVIVRTVMDNPGGIHLLAVGPMTNVALAIRREPRLLANLSGLTLMAGAIRGLDGLHLPLAEHNLKCDPEAAAIVFAQPEMKTVVPLDVTTRVRIRSSDLPTIREAGSGFHEAVARQVELYPSVVHGGATDLHDPLAAMALTRPELMTWRDLHVEIDVAGPHAGMTLARTPSEKVLANARVALDVDITAAERAIVERIATPVTARG
ncbi:MAG TPA: nucleoside hydrolase [Thermomicrobiales bacterium]|jgi:purine nucleosidase|nr:nucleoside hydrolase [Thermomicrobiales bacterium]